MKAIICDPGHPCRFRLFADSTIGRDVMPLFVPDIDGLSWALRVYVAVRVGRLGKCITRRFVARHIDAVGLVGVLEPAASDSSFAASGILSVLDNAITTGRWIDSADPLPDSLSFCVNGAEVEVGTFRALAEDAVADVSRYATLKTGDIIMPASAYYQLPLVRDLIIDASIGSAPLIHIKVK